MDGSISPTHWATFLKTEYLDRYLPSGGAAIKFPVPLDSDSRVMLFSELRSLGQEDDFLTFSIDSCETRVHMPEQIFFRISEQVNWGDLSKKVLFKLIAKESYQVPASPADPIFTTIAETNGIDPQFFLGEIRKMLQKGVFKRKELSKDFRVAMLQLCLAAAVGNREGLVAVDTLTDWLTGANRSISAVKPYQIFTRIARHNARHFLESLFRWIRFAGYKGTIIVLDLERLSLGRNPKDGSVFYTKAALLDAYEVLRQFIDSADRLTSVLVAAVPGPEFLDEDTSSRGMGAYEALKFRVYDEIRDRTLVNPMTALVRVEATAG